MRRGKKSGGDDRLVDDAPAAAFAGPELALEGAVRQVVRAVVLLERDHHQVLRAGVGEDAHVVHADLDPGLAGGHMALACAPGGEIALLGAEVWRVIRDIALRVEAFPIRVPSPAGGAEAFAL